MADHPDPLGVAADPGREALIAALIRHDVDFVIIGGAAIQSYGRRYDTLDVDVTPATDPKNLARLATALNELECRLVIDPVDASGWVTLPVDYFTPRTPMARRAPRLARTGDPPCGLGSRTYEPAGPTRRVMREWLLGDQRVLGSR